MGVMVTEDIHSLLKETRRKSSEWPTVLQLYPAAKAAMSDPKNSGMLTLEQFMMDIHKYIYIVFIGNTASFTNALIKDH